MIKPVWNRLDHKQKRIAAAGAAITLILALVYFSGASDTEPRQSKKREEAIRSVLTDRSTRDISIDSLSANMQIVSRENEKLKKEIEKISRELQETKEESVTSKTLEEQLSELKEQLETVQKQSEAATDAYTQRLSTDGEQSLSDDDTEQHEQQKRYSETGESSFELADQTTAEEVFSSAPPANLTPKNPETGERAPLRIVSHAQPQPKEKVVEEEIDEVYMPAGSILTGVLLNGLDAPTGQGARRDPFPAALRVQKEAVLPNRYRADVRECFMIVSGYGDLSTERAMLRGETISCIREDGGVIESRVNSYVVGEDGKAGVRGRLVSKQGQVIAKSLMAGFASGVASAFDVDPVPVLNTSPTGKTQYQRSMSSDMLQGAAMKGTSNALDRVAQFYIEMAESMFPVVEVDAGRQVDIIVTGGVNLKIRQ